MSMYLPPRGASTLAPLTELCPGLHGDGDATTRRVPWRALLCGDGARRFAVPAFQRAYCWPPELAESWFDDAVVGAARGARDVGTVITRASVVVDGQQRLTTSLLAVAALRDAAAGLRAAPDSGEAFVLGAFRDECEAVLFRAGGRGRGPRPAAEGARWPAARLEPSFFDRRPFHGVLAGDGTALAAEAAGDGSAVAAAKAALDARVARDLERWRAGGLGAQLERLRFLLAAQLDHGFTVRHVDVVAPHALDSQLFLYVQERSLLGEAPAGGVRAGAVDLARNLLAAAFADLAPDRQDEVFRDLWLEPLQRRRDLRATLEAFVADGAFVSEFEAAVGRRRAALGSVDGELEVYAKLVSRLAEIERELGAATEREDGGADAGELVQMAALGDGTLTPAPTQANYARGRADLLRVAAERLLRDLAAFARARDG